MPLQKKVMFPSFEIYKKSMTSTSLTTRRIWKFPNGWGAMLVVDDLYPSMKFLSLLEDGELVVTSDLWGGEHRVHCNDDEDVELHLRSVFALDPKPTNHMLEPQRNQI